MDFSKVMRSLFREAPMVPDPNVPGLKRFVPPDAPVKKDNRNIQQRQQSATKGRLSRPHDDGSQGGKGFWMEKVAQQHVLPAMKPEGNYNHVDISHPTEHEKGVKTDIYEDQGDPSKNPAFSVKLKMDNEFPQKVHQTGINSAGATSKLMMKNAPKMAREAINMYLGESGEFVNAGDMKTNHADHFEALKNHLTNNKLDIFNNIVRKHGSSHYGESPYVDHDPRMIDKMISHRITGPFNSGTTDIRPIQGKVTEGNFKDLKWFDDGKRFYLGDKENATTDERMIDLWPIDKEGSSWSNREGDGGPQSGQRGHVPGKREAGLAEPGQFKATMATNPEFLDKYFPKEKEFYLDDNGMSLNLLAQEDTDTKPTTQPQRQSGNFLQRLRDRQRANDAVETGKQYADMEDDIPDLSGIPF